LDIPVEFRGSLAYRSVGINISIWDKQVEIWNIRKGGEGIGMREKRGRYA
jgi:hypothetical protein